MSPPLAHGSFDCCRRLGWSRHQSGAAPVWHWHSSRFHRATYSPGTVASTSYPKLVVLCSLDACCCEQSGSVAQAGCPTSGQLPRSSCHQTSSHPMIHHRSWRGTRPDTRPDLWLMRRQAARKSTSRSRYGDRPARHGTARHSTVNPGVHGHLVRIGTVLPQTVFSQFFQKSPGAV